MTSTISRIFICFAFTLWFTATPVIAAEKLLIEVTEPFVELRTGPGDSYPKFYSAERGAKIEILKRRNDWYKVRYQPSQHRTKTGWVHRRDIVETVVANENTNETGLATSDHPRMKIALNPRIYLGFNYGQSSSADVAGFLVGYAINPVLAIEAQANEIIGKEFQETSWSGNVSLTPFDRWRVAPFFQVGAGGIDTEAQQGGSQQNDGSDHFFQSTAGFGVLLSKRYRLRFEYRHMNILQSKDQNRDIESWQVGFIGYF